MYSHVHVIMMIRECSIVLDVIIYNHMCVQLNFIYVNIYEIRMKFVWNPLEVPM